MPLKLRLLEVFLSEDLAIGKLVNLVSAEYTTDTRLVHDMISNIDGFLPAR